MTDIEKTVLQTAIDHYGENRQINQLVEEMAELAVAISKCARKIGSIDAVAEEIADVGIMLDQTIIIFGCSDLVKHHREYKMTRLEERIKFDGSV